MSQIRKTLDEAGYELQYLESDEQGEPCQAVLLSDTGVLEVWYVCDDHCGYTIEIDGIGYEYVCDFDE